MDTPTKTLKFEDAVGGVFRHKRLFNYVVSPLDFENDMVKCHVGKDDYKEFPMDYFKRDWKRDDTISYEVLVKEINRYESGTPFTQLFEEKYEADDGKPHSYIHFNDDIEEKMVRFPTWHLTTCTKLERAEKINPYTMILPVKDGLEVEVQNELDLMNEIRQQNEFIQIDDFSGFEFGLIKYLEKKYLRSI